MSQKREPKSKNAIEKKNKIIKKGFEIICNNGYNNVNCVDIAKYSEVSTGIIYQYFDNKKDIFIQGIDNYSNDIIFPVLKILKKIDIEKENFEEIVEKIIDETVKVHKKYKKAHQEITAMSWADEDIAYIIKNNEIKTTSKIAENLVKNNINVEHIGEKIHIINNIVDNYCHEIIWHKHKEIDYHYMKKYIIKIIVKILLHK